MSRPVEIRTSYDNDMGFLTRLAKAVEKDTTQPSDWIREVLCHINSIIQKFAEANNRKHSV